MPSVPTSIKIPSGLLTARNLTRRKNARRRSPTPTEVSPRKISFDVGFAEVSAARHTKRARFHVCSLRCRRTRTGRFSSTHI